MLQPAADKNKPLLVVVAGPTASGKTGVAIQLARHFQTDILSADSRQCYRELNIGVAKPNPAELAAAKHFFIDSHSIHHPADAASFATYGLGVLDNIFSEKNIAIAAGGTGLYIKALCQGVDDIPEVPAPVREQVVELFNAGGLEELQKKLKETDPLYYREGEINNPQRVMRALEVAMHTGFSIKHYQQGLAKPRPFRVLYLGMEVAREQLHRQINQRVDTMMETGLLNEAEQLLPFRQLNALQTVGYAELFDYFDNKISLQEAVEQIKIHTRQYAKRQITWFKKVPGIHWIAPASLDEMKRIIGEQLNNRLHE
jgi:tRNA dimethylallyltransferase